MIRLAWAPGSAKALKEARRLLRDATPLKSNCGKLCGGACCQSDETGENGMLLFPGEERLYREPRQDFPFGLVRDHSLFSGGFRLVCQGSCPREHRPLACRLFPLRVRAEGAPGPLRAVAEIDPRAWAVCPLPEEGGLRAMDPGFVKAVEAAGEVLLQNPRLKKALLKEQRLLEEMTRL